MSHSIEERVAADDNNYYFRLHPKKGWQIFEIVPRRWENHDPMHLPPGHIEEDIILDYEATKEEPEL